MPSAGVCRIKESLDTIAVGVAGADDCGEGRALHITAAGRMAAHFIVCLSALLRREPVLACWSLSTNTKYPSESFSAPVRPMRAACEHVGVRRK